MTHLTLTGYYAGQTLCGARKEFDASTGQLKEQYLHAMYAPIERLAANELPNWQPLCPACKKEWDDAALEDAR
jgi:hypothetical protein